MNLKKLELDIDNNALNFIKIKDIAKFIDGIKYIDVSLKSENITIFYDKEKTNFKLIKKKLSQEEIIFVK